MNSIIKSLVSEINTMKAQIEGAEMIVAFARESWRNSRGKESEEYSYEQYDKCRSALRDKEFKLRYYRSALCSVLFAEGIEYDCFKPEESVKVED